MEQIYSTCAECLALFSIDPDTPAMQDFCALVDTAALFAAYPQYHVSFGDVVYFALVQRRLSPVVYWSRQKRQLMPLLGADAETLRALGLGRVCERRTVPILARALAEQLAGCNLDYYIEMCDKVPPLAAAIKAACAERDRRRTDFDNGGD